MNIFWVTKLSDTVSGSTSVFLSAEKIRRSSKLFRKFNHANRDTVRRRQCSNIIDADISSTDFEVSDDELTGADMEIDQNDNTLQMTG